MAFLSESVVVNCNKCDEFLKVGLATYVIFLQLIQHCMFMQEKADPLESIDWMYIFCNLGSYIAMIND